MLRRIGLKRSPPAAAFTAGLLVFGLTASAAQAPLGPASATLAAAGCRQAYGLSQSMDGRLSGCLRIGALRPGPHTVVLLQVPNLSTNTTAVSRTLKAGENGGILRPGPTKRVRPPKEPAASLTLSPDSGGPGTVVTITGRLGSRLPSRQLYPNFCWDGCGIGLAYGAVPIQRTSPTTFRARIVVPAAPWIEGDPVRVAPLVSGDYSIGLQCLVIGKGCESNTPEGSATFHLRAASSPSWCSAQASCARLFVSPAAGIPGDVVKVTGFAPLVSVTGSDQPFVFQLEVLGGRPHGPEVDFTERKGSVMVTFGRGALDVQAPPSFASLRHTAPIAEVSDRLPLISANPASPSTVGWCAGGAVDVSSSQTTIAIPTASTVPALTKLGFEVPSGALPQCEGLALIDSASGSVAGVAAAFPAAPAVGGPPFYDIPLVTYDAGNTWTPLPAPRGSSLQGFGGFRYEGSEVEAVFAAMQRGGSRYFPAFEAGKPLAMVGSGGSDTWRAEPLGCPSGGPCVTLGPFMPGNCAMIEVTQPVLRSTDGGVRWSQPQLPDLPGSCAESELVATSSRSELLVNSMSPYPLLRSNDGGATWSDVGLPLAPREQRTRGLGPGPGGITVLPDGGLLLTGGQGYSGGWELLRDGGRSWCRVRTPAPGLQRRYELSAVTVIGGQLWWLTGSPASDSTAAINQLPLAALSC